MSDFIFDYNAGRYVQARIMAQQPVHTASSSVNYLIEAARRTELTPVDIRDLAAIAAELEITAAALRSVIAKPKAVMLQAAE